MAATLTEEGRIPLGGSKVLCWGTVLMDSSYATGGEVIDATGDLGYDIVLFEQQDVNLQWDKANQKVLAFWDRIQNAAAGKFVEVTSTTDLSAITAQYLALAST